MNDDLVEIARGSHGEAWYTDETMKEPRLLQHVMADEITRLRAALEASEERERAIELRFWQTVDRDGLTGLPSDMWAALEQLVRDRAALATARREGMDVEPTRAMLDAARDWSFSKYHQGIGDDAAAGCYRAMRAAAIRAALERKKDE